MAERTIKIIVLGAEYDNKYDVTRLDALFGAGNWTSHSHMDSLLKLMIKCCNPESTNHQLYSQLLNLFNLDEFKKEIEFTDPDNNLAGITNWTSKYWIFAFHMLLEQNDITNKMNAIYFDRATIHHYKHAKGTEEVMHAELIMLAKLFLTDGGKFYIPRYTVWRGPKMTLEISDIVDKSELAKGGLKYAETVPFPKELEAENGEYDVFTYSSN